MFYESIARYFGLLADMTRIRILRVLGDRSVAGIKADDAAVLTLGFECAQAGMQDPT